MNNIIPSKYTAVIYNLRKQGFDFGLKDYPIFDESHREILNKKLLDHYNFEEIGLETPQLFKIYLNTTMNEIMPYYNERYKSIIEFNEKLLNNLNVKEIFERESQSSTSGNTSSESNTTTSSKANSTANQKSIFNNTPQGQILKNAIDDQNYATTLTQTKDDGTSDSSATGSDTSSSTNNASGTGTENYTRTQLGNTGLTIFNILDEFRKSIINVDMEIIEDSKIQDLFLKIL